MYIETLEAFTLLRPTLITFLIVSLLVFVKAILPKGKIKVINGFTIASISVISIFVSAQILFYIGIIADEINLGGDPVSFYMFLIILGLGCINPIIYFYRHSERKR